MDTEADLQFRPRTGKAASAPLLPEVEAYLQLLMVIFLMNSKRYKEVPGMFRGGYLQCRSRGDHWELPLIPLPQARHGSAHLQPHCSEVETE